MLWFASLALAVALSIGLLLSSWRTRSALAGERDALQRVDELVRERQSMRLEADILRVLIADDAAGRIDRLLGLLLPHPSDGYLLVRDETQTTLASRGHVPPSLPPELPFVIAFSGGELLGTACLGSRRLTEEARSYVSDVLSSAYAAIRAEAAPQLIETKLALQSEVAEGDAIAQSLPRYLDRIGESIGADRVAVHLVQPDGTFRVVAFGGSDAEALSSLADSVAAGETTSSRAVAVEIVVGDRPMARLVATAERSFRLSHDDRRLIDWAASHLSVVLRQTAGRLALQRDARLDRLTGLSNRATFDAELAGAATKCERESISLALILVDVDHFKQVNDTHGHLAGDAALRAVAGTIGEAARSIRAADLVTTARYGGEELALLLQGIPPEVVARVAEDVRRRIERLQVRYRDVVVPLTASAGWAVAQPPVEGDELIDAADAALYAAKQAGRNCTRRGTLPKRAAAENTFAPR